MIVLIQSFRSLYCGPAAFTAASAYWTAWNRLRTKVASCAGKASSQALRIPGAPSDRHRQFLGREHAVPEPELLQAGTKSEARLMPFTAFAPSMQTPTAPLPLSLRDPRLSMLEQNYQSPVILAQPALGMQGCRVIRLPSHVKATAIKYRSKPTNPATSERKFRHRDLQADQFCAGPPKILLRKPHLSMPKYNLQISGFSDQPDQVSHERLEAAAIAISRIRTARS